ncbi:MAG: DUF3862 domain-containing protein [Vicinamibacterales bacterium]
MELLLLWGLLGAAIGVYAAQKKGFSTVGGAIGGWLLGPLAFLLFFVSGIVSSKEQQRKCPFCAEWIRPEATVCRHCHKEVPPLTTAAPRRGMRVLKGVLTLIVAVVFLGLVALVVFNPGGPSMSNALQPTITMAEFSKLQTGMTYQQVVEIVGVPGEEMSRSDLAGFTTVMYGWKNAGGSNMNAMFQNGALINKAQFGLR